MYQMDSIAAPKESDTSGRRKSLRKVSHIAMFTERLVAPYAIAKVAGSNY